MSSVQEPHLHLEVGHILFLDIVGYSKLLADEQKEVVQELNQIVRETEHFRAAEAAGKLTRLPTGDGMVLIFTNNPEAPVECALEISKALQSHPKLKVRMDIHSGRLSAAQKTLLLLHALDDPLKILDAAGGNGQNTRWLAGQGHSVTLLDSNPAMLDQAKEGLADERLLERCQLGRSKQVKVPLPKLKLINEKAGCHPARRKQAQSRRCR
jgi:Methyltransferase domain